MSQFHVHLIPRVFDVRDFVALPHSVHGRLHAQGNGAGKIGLAYIQGNDALHCRAGKVLVDQIPGQIRQGLKLPAEPPNGPY